MPFGRRHMSHPSSAGHGNGYHDRLGWAPQRGKIEGRAVLDLAA